MKVIAIVPLVITIVLLMLGGCRSTTAPEADSAWMGEADPNPMQVGTTTSIPVKTPAGEVGYVFINNSLGQPVRTYSIVSGNQVVKWDGRDQDGRICASGVYYYTLLTPSSSQTRKLVIIR